MPKWQEVAIWFTLILITEAIAFYYVKYVSLHQDQSQYLIISVVMYIATILCFYKVLALGQGLTIISILWSIASVLYSIFIGVFLFSESITHLQLIGTCLGIVAIILITIDEKPLNL